MISFGQNRRKDIHIGNSDTSKHGLLILKMENGRDIITAEPSFVIRSSEIASQRLVPKSEIKTKYNDNNISGVLELIPKDGLEILSLKEIYKRFSIDSTGQLLPVAIDGRIIKDKKNIYASLNAIKNVKVINGKYLNINTKL